MTAKDLINYMIPPLKPDDPLAKAQEWMDEFKSAELPVASEGKFLGLIDEDMIYDQMNANVVGDLQLKGQACFVKHDRHYYDVLSTSYNQGHRLVAVIDNEEHYLGVVSIQDVVEAFAQTSSLNSPGAILVLSVNKQDYSLSQIARMIELNDVKILSSHMTPIVDNGNTLRLTLKLDSEEISQIKTVLANNNIRVEATFNASVLSYDEKERLDMLMKYLTP